MERLRPARSAATWTRRHLAAERVRRRAPQPSLLVRYEDFVADPDQHLSRVAALVGEPEPSRRVLDGWVHLGANHTVSGNPVRLASGPIYIREDTEWRSRLPAPAKAVVTTISWPLLLRYRYVQRPRR